MRLFLVPSAEGLKPILFDRYSISITRCLQEQTCKYLSGVVSITFALTL